MASTFFIRRYHPSDCQKIMQLFYDTVHTINAADYSPAQLDAWAPLDADQASWHRSLSQNYVVIIENKGEIIGFGDLRKDGYFDRLFVHKDYQRQKIATMISEIIEHRARQWDLEMILTEASVTAKPFFEKRGYQVIVEQKKRYREETFLNYVMSLPLD